MNLAFQIPTKYLNVLAECEDFHFALAHLVLQDNHYAEFFRRSAKFVLMDNGVHETSEPLPLEKLAEAAWRCEADAVIPPDFFFDRERTLWHFHEAVNMWGKRRLWPVVQGTDTEDTIRCANEYIMSGAEVVCIPYRLRRKRIWLSPVSPIMPTAIHYLSYDKVEDLSVMRIRNTTMDTGKPIRLAQNGLPFRDIPEGLPKLDMYGDLDVNLAIQNIKELRRHVSTP